MSRKLPPLDFSGDKEKYEAIEEKTEIKFNKCKHKAEFVSGTELKCVKCGAGWLGDNLRELKKLLDTV